MFLDRRRGLQTFSGDPDHVPSPWGALKRVLDASSIEPDDVFVDVGCGLGRILYLASKYPFARIEGVEISAPIAERARVNVPGAKIVTADVRDYELPADASYVYLFNPFRGATFQAFADKLRRHPRTLTLIYLYPVEHDRVMATGRARLVRSHSGPRLLPGPRAPQTLHVYQLSCYPSPSPR